MTDLEIFAEWHEKSLAKHIITKNAQAGAIIEFAKYYHKKQLSICDVGCSYSLQEVREIVLELHNATMYGHSHKLTRFELQDKLGKIKTKHGLDYKKGIDYN